MLDEPVLAAAASSMGVGYTFLPPAVMITSFLRPVIRRKPCSSSAPMSPVRKKPSSIASADASGMPW